MTTNDIAEVDPSNSTRPAVGSTSSRSNEPCIDLDAIRRSVPAVYDGPWYVQFREEDGRWLVGYPTDNPKAGLIATVPDYGEQLAAFIAAARTDVPALVAEVRRLRAEREHMELNPTGTVDWLKNRVNELTAELAALNQETPK